MALSQFEIELTEIFRWYDNEFTKIGNVYSISIKEFEFHMKDYRFRVICKYYTKISEEFICKFVDKIWWKDLNLNPNFNFQSCTPKFKLLYGKYFK